MPFHALKVVCNENQGEGQEGGILSVQVSRIVAIEVCLLFNFAVFFIFNVFPFPPSKAQSLGDVPMNKKKTQQSIRHRFEFVFLCNGVR